jgi:hypothetical protein
VAPGGIRFQVDGGELFQGNDHRHRYFTEAVGVGLHLVATGG